MNDGNPENISPNERFLFLTRGEDIPMIILKKTQNTEEEPLTDQELISGALGIIETLNILYPKRDTEHMTMVSTALVSLCISAEISEEEALDLFSRNWEDFRRAFKDIKENGF